jgi:lipopolysaccharide transport system permease protein
VTGKEHTEHWDIVIRPRTGWFDLRLRDLLRYRDLLLLFVRRDFVAMYKQTLLGPVWFFLQPVLTSLTFVVVFGNLAGISTDGTPQMLFYLSGITLWNYFSDTLNKTSETFIANANIFGKVYFPRIIVPASIVVSNLVKLGIQLLLFLGVWMWFLVTTDRVHPNTTLLLVPILVMLMGLLGFGCGIVITSLTTKYRDLRFLISFGVQLLMYASPIVYPLSVVPERYRWILVANPITGIIETFKHGFLGTGMFNAGYLAYSALFALVLVILGLLLFSRVEKSFMDTV